MKNYRKNQTLFPANSRIFTTGYYISLYGIAIILLWIGIFKFTPTEAAGIQPLVGSHPLMSWLYRVFEVQTVSNLIGVIEILTGIAIILSPFQRIFRYAASAGILGTFLITLSFLFTSDRGWHIVDGIPVTDFFILKDLVCLGFGLMVINFPGTKSSSLNQ